MQKKGTIRLWHRTDKPNKSGAAPIHIIYSIGGKRQYINTGAVVYPEQYDSGEVTALSPSIGRKKYGLKIYEIPSKEDAKRDNQLIYDLITTIKRISDRFRLDGINYTSAMVKAEIDNIRYPEKVETKDNSIVAFIERYILESEGSRPKQSLQVYRTALRRVKEYNKDITFDKIDYTFFEGFHTYLSNECDLNSITVAKQLTTFKTFLNYAAKKGIIVNQQYKSFAVKRATDIEVIALTQTEFDTLLNLDLTDKPRFDAIRDVFLFSCSTGMRFSDLSQLAHHQIKEDCILQTVAKTKQKLRVPLNPYSRQILAKYSNLPKPLPVISNQKSNDALHELCKEAGFNEPIEIVRFKGNERVSEVFPKHELITMHTGRKTFCTLSLAKGMSAQEVMAISGHKDYKSFKRYINITSDHSQKAMAKAWE